MSGWRARIGVVYPAAVTERFVNDFYANAPDGVVIAVNTLGAEGFADYQAEDLKREVMEAARVVAMRSVDCIAILGTPFANALGSEGERELLRELELKHGIPVYTSQSAGAAALASLGVSRIAIVSPHPDEMLSGIAAYLADEGMEARPSGIRSTSAAPKKFDELDVMSIEKVYRQVRSSVLRWADLEAVYMPGAQVPVPSVPIMEGDFGIPIVCATHAVLWMACELLRIRDWSFEKKGVLLDRLCPQPWTANA